MIAAARAEGLAIDCDAYPYAAGSNPLKNLLPQWVQSGGIEAMLARLALAETRGKMRADIERDGLNNWGRIPSWDCVQISISPTCRSMPARRWRPLAAARGRDPVDARLRFLIEDKGATRVLITSIAEDDIREIVRSPRLWSGRMAIASPITGSSARGCRIRAFTAPSREFSAITCIASSSLPLELGGPQDDRRHGTGTAAADRGLLREGYRADIAIFDPADFRDRATYAQPHQYPSGARTTVLVNGMWWSKTPATPARYRAWFCGATIRAR